MQFTVYSRGEEAWMARWQRLKDAALAPLIEALVRLKVPAWAVSGVSAGVAAGGLWVGLASGRWDIFLLLLLLHVLLDGVDGALARRVGVGTLGGVIDAAADMVGIVAASGAAAALLLVPLWLAVVYTALYALVVGLALQRRSRGIPYSWLLRPRLPLYSVLAFDVIVGTRLLLPLLVLASVVLAVQVISGWRALYISRA